jgi:hypothetical protein
MIKDFFETSRALSNKTFQAKGMLVVAGRPHIIEYKKQFEELLPRIAREKKMRVRARARILLSF